MKVLVCGGREYANYEQLYSCLDEIAKTRSIDLLIHGDANGADRLADRWARMRSVPTMACPAMWRAHGRAAGPLRNQQMIDECRPDLVVAFSGGRGTEDMVRRAEAAGIEVMRIEE